MAGRATPHRLPTVEEYLALEEESAVRHEYVAGMIYAHAGGTSSHNAIAANVLAALWNAARGRSCRVYGSDMRLRAADDVFYYPDARWSAATTKPGMERSISTLLACSSKSRRRAPSP